MSVVGVGAGGAEPQCCSEPVSAEGESQVQSLTFWRPNTGSHIGVCSDLESFTYGRDYILTTIAVKYLSVMIVAQMFTDKVMFYLYLRYIKCCLLTVYESIQSILKLRKNIFKLPGEPQ